MKLPAIPTGAATVTGLATWLRSLVMSIAAGWNVEHTSEGRHQFDWVDVPWSASDFVGNASMTWTVDQTDLTLFRYRVVGQCAFVRFAVVGSDVGGTADPSLSIRIPAELTLATNNYQVGSLLYSDAGGTRGLGLCVQSGNYILCQKADASNWTLTTGDNTTVIGEIQLELA